MNCSDLIEFAREFAEENCAAVCGEVPPTEGALSTLQGLEAACRDNQCVLVREEDDEEEEPLQTRTPLPNALCI